MLSLLLLGGITTKAQPLVSPLNKDGKPTCGISIYVADPKTRAEFTGQLGRLIDENYLIYSDDLDESWNIFPGRSAYGMNE